MPETENSESSSTFITDQLYDFNVLTGEFTQVTSFSIKKRVFSLLSPLRSIFVLFLSLLWEWFVFSAVFTAFAQKKAVSFIYSLEDTKDLLVRFLMWRRGFLFKPTTHVGLLAIGSSAVVISGIFQTTNVEPKDFTRDLVLAAENTPETIIPADRPRSEIVYHKVKEGESLSAIAQTYNVSVDSVKWASGVEGDEITPGNELTVPPVTGIIYQVQSGDTLQSIAEKYAASAQSIADYPFNYIDDSLALSAGQSLIIPDGKKPQPVVSRPVYSRPAPAFAAAGGGLFAWPVPGGHVSQYPSWWHPAVDIAASYGSPIYALGNGTITYTSFQGYGFGNHVIIEHEDGYRSTYAHMSAINVGSGQVIAKGQLIGRVGCSGFCTGPHLHLELSRGGTKLNPLSVLQ